MALLLDMNPVDWAALDTNAQKMVRCVQLATCSGHTLPGKQLPVTPELLIIWRILQTGQQAQADLHA